MPARRVALEGASDARDRLLDAASYLFARHGYQAIGLRDLASHMGLKAGSLYHHVDSKQALLFELIESSFTDLLYETKQRLKATKAGNDRLGCFVQTFASYSEEHPDRLTLMTREAVNLNAEQAEQIAIFRAEYTDLLSTIVTAERKPFISEPKTQAREIARAILSMLCGQVHWICEQEQSQLLGTVLCVYARGIVHTSLEFRHTHFQPNARPRQINKT